MSPLATMFTLLLVATAITVATALPLMGTFMERAARRRPGR